MSTRAYKVEVPAVIADLPAWNVTRQQEINDFLDLDDYEGEVEVEVAKIRELLDSDIEMEPEQRKQFEKDIAGETDEYIYYNLG